MPCFFISKSMARATTSRGASSARRVVVGHEALGVDCRRVSAAVEDAAFAAQRLGDQEARSAGWYRQVGWNWMNSMLPMRQPARQAMAMPSPVEVSGLVV